MAQPYKQQAALESTATLVNPPHGRPVADEKKEKVDYTNLTPDQRARWEASLARKPSGASRLGEIVSGLATAGLYNCGK